MLVLLVLLLAAGGGGDVVLSCMIYLDLVVSMSGLLSCGNGDSSFWLASAATTAQVVTPFTVMATMGSAVTVVGEASAADDDDFVADFCLLPLPRRRFHIDDFLVEVMVGDASACSAFRAIFDC